MCKQVNIKKIRRLSHSEAGRLGAIANKNINNWLKRQEKIVAYYKNPKLCALCKKPIEYKKRRTNSYCSHSCSATYNNISRNKRRNIVVVPADYFVTNNGGFDLNKYVKHCLMCGVPISHRSKFCSINCATKYRNLQTEKEIQSGCVVSQERLRMYLLRKVCRCMNPDCCWDWSKNKDVVLEIHHIDGNSDNNVLSNVMLLCPNCHSLTDTYKARNTGKGRASRRQRYREGKSF